MPERGRVVDRRPALGRDMAAAGPGRLPPSPPHTRKTCRRREWRGRAQGVAHRATRNAMHPQDEKGSFRDVAIVQAMHALAPASRQGSYGPRAGLRRAAPRRPDRERSGNEQRERPGQRIAGSRRGAGQNRHASRVQGQTRARRDRQVDNTDQRRPPRGEVGRAPTGGGPRRDSLARRGRGRSATADDRRRPRPSRRRTRSQQLHRHSRRRRRCRHRRECHQLSR